MCLHNLPRGWSERELIRRKKGRNCPHINALGTIPTASIPDAAGLPSIRPPGRKAQGLRANWDCDVADATGDSRLESANETDSLPGPFAVPSA
jgi:hypothetical protein